MAYTNPGIGFTEAQKTGLGQDRYLENRLLEMIKLEKADFPFHMLGKDYVIPANQGTKTVQFRRYLALPQFANGHQLNEGEIPTEPLMTEAVTVSATVDQFGAFMRLFDVQEALHIDNIKSIYQPELARHAAELIERNVIGKLYGEASLYYVGGLTAEAFVEEADAKLTWLDLRKVALYMKTQLRGGHTKFGGKPVVVVHPNVMQDLVDEAKNLNYVFAAGQDNTPIRIGSLEQFQLFGIYVQEALIAPTKDAKEMPGIDTKASAADLTTGEIYFNSTDGKYYKATGASAWSALSPQPTKIYVSFMLGKDPFIVTTLANGSVKFMMTGYEATKDDPLGQTATLGYKLWTGAKVIDPLAIYAIHSFSGFGTFTRIDQIVDQDPTVSQNQPIYEKAEATQRVGAVDNYK